MAILHAQNALMKTRSLRIGPRLTRFHRVATAVEGCYVPMWSGLAKYFPGRRSRKPCKLPLSVTSSFLLVLLAPSSQRPPCLRLPTFWRCHCHSQSGCYSICINWTLSRQWTGWHHLTSAAQSSMAGLRVNRGNTRGSFPSLNSDATGTFRWSRGSISVTLASSTVYQDRIVL